MKRKINKPKLNDIFSKYIDKSVWINLPRKQKKAVKKKRQLTVRIVAVHKSDGSHTLMIQPINPIKL